MKLTRGMYTSYFVDNILNLFKKCFKLLELVLVARQLISLSKIVT
jgi:hypothetical protein